jgi:acyl carrier protein
MVMVRENEPDDKRLVAYVVPVPGQRPQDSDFRHFLKQTLPNYMIPSVFVLLEALPLMPNGKVDRRALLALDQSVPDGEVLPVDPRTPIEQHLRDFWQQVIGVEQVGVYDDFFELGGNSLLATQIISRIREAFQVNLSIGDFFKEPKIASLALLIEPGQIEKEENHLGKIQRIARP